MSELYRDLNSYLRDRFGERVQKVPIDAGFTCPNRDGTISSTGCIFCSPRGSAAGFVDLKKSVSEQLEQGIATSRARYRASKFIAYFQAFTNTYLPGAAGSGTPKDLAAVLMKVYQPALDHPDIVGLAVGTRPDCLSDAVIEMLLDISRTKLVFLELGLQSVHDATLSAINRGHDFASFADAVRRVENLRTLSSQPAGNTGLDIVVHLILGLPGETREMMLETARQVALMSVQGVKIHMLHVIRGTPLETMYRAGTVPLLSLEAYCDLVCEVLDILPSEMVIHRLTGEASSGDLVAPEWVLDKSKVRAAIQARLQQRRQAL